MIAALLAFALSPCAPLPGVEALVASPARWIVLGEQHGTAEAPVAYADLVCHASAAKAVVAAIEQSEADQPIIDAYMASDGGEAAKAALLTGQMWQSRDGRSSVAYLALFETLRVMVREGRVIRVVAFQPTVTGAYDPAAYEAAMAKRLRAASPDAGTRVVALVGNVHAMLKLTNFGPGYMPAAGLLPKDATLTLNIGANGGSAWTCDQTGCDAHDLWPAPKPYPRGIVLGGDSPWSGYLNIGGPATASPPAL